MPRKRTYAHRRRTDYNAWHFYQGLSGNSWFPDTTLSEHALSELWEQWREDLLSLHVAAYPGSRPFGWWQHDATARRETVAGVHPFDMPDYPPHLKRLWYGLPAHWFVLDSELTTLYEDQPTYLDRLQLWLPGERQQFLRHDWRETWEWFEPRLSLGNVRRWWEQQQ